jgi:RNA polymerase sigma factor (sigma-70 family)
LTDLQRVYLTWRERTLPRWRSQIGEDAGDLLTEVWVRLHRIEPEYCHTSDPATLRYIEQVASYVVRDMGRAKARRSQLFATALELGAAGLSSEGFDALESRQDVEDLVEEASLTIRQRVAILGRLSGMAPTTLAKLIGVTEMGLRDHEREAVRRLRQIARAEES